MVKRILRPLTTPLKDGVETGESTLDSRRTARQVRFRRGQDRCRRVRRQRRYPNLPNLNHQFRNRPEAAEEV